MDELIDLRSMQTVVGDDSEPANALSTFRTSIVVAGSSILNELERLL
jgi:hypothetical protein